MLSTASKGLPLAHRLTHLLFLVKWVSVSELHGNMLCTGLLGLPLAHYPSFNSYMTSLSSCVPFCVSFITAFRTHP